MKELVLHTGYGKFHLTKEIVDRMREKGFDFEKNNLRNFGDDYYCSGMDDVEFRMNPILVESVRELKAELEAQDLPFNEKNYHYFNKLTIVEFNLKLEIVDYYDGKERLEFNGVEIDTF